jgi:hypothetical protein
VNYFNKCYPSNNQDASRNSCSCQHRPKPTVLAQSLQLPLCACCRQARPARWGRWSVRSAGPMGPMGCRGATGPQVQQAPPAQALTASSTSTRTTRPATKSASSSTMRLHLRRHKRSAHRQPRHFPDYSAHRPCRRNRCYRPHRLQAAGSLVPGSPG